MLPLASLPGSSLGFLNPYNVYLDFLFPVNLKFAVQTSNLQTQQLIHKHHIKMQVAIQLTSGMCLSTRFSTFLYLNLRMMFFRLT